MNKEMSREHYETYHGPNRIGTYACHMFGPGWKPEFRDERWENVTAHITSPPQGYFYEDENSQFNPAELTEFLIEVRLGPNVLYSKIIVENGDLKDARMRLFQFTLDKMVEQVDHYIEMATR